MALLVTDIFYLVPYGRFFVFIMAMAALASFVMLLNNLLLSASKKQEKPQNEG
jgi:hypothetical protein